VAFVDDIVSRVVILEEELAILQLFKVEVKRLRPIKAKVKRVRPMEVQLTSLKIILSDLQATLVE